MHTLKSNEIAAIVTHTERVGTSYYGNPQYRVELRDDTAEPGQAYSSHLTMSNTMLAYAIENREYREHVHIFTLTRAGRIRSARLA